MKRVIIFQIILLLFIFNNSYGDSKIGLSGRIRNDSIYQVYKDYKNERYFNDILENKIVLRYETELWRYYADGRLYLYYGEMTKDMAKDYEAKLMRSFVRFSPEIGDFTLGKTYINLGNPGIFNPFEINKQVNHTDLNYDKEGILAIEYDMPIGDMSGYKIYGSTYNSEIDENIPGDTIKQYYSGGMSLWANLKGFDLGLVGNHNKDNSNITGAYFRGDLILGIVGAYGYHFDDDFKNGYSEANFGLDYSFFESHLIVTSMFYYNQNGADKTEEYQQTADSYFFARYYLYNSITYIYDEFITAGFGCFINLIDKSTMIYPSVNYIIADGLKVTLMVYVITGKEDQEFSYDTSGVVNTLLRIEAKF